MTKTDCNQNQYIIRAAFVCKSFEDAATLSHYENLAKQMWFINIDLFVICVFHQLIYNQEISDLFTTRSFLELLKYYTQ